MMGYFSNGTEGRAYQAKWCNDCSNDAKEKPCMVWGLHLMYNAKHCNDENSLLHALIPRTKDGLGNEECTMFTAFDYDPESMRGETEADRKYKAWQAVQKTVAGYGDV